MIVELVSILFSCTSAVYLGLADEVRSVTGLRLKVLGCSKCLCFWVTLLSLIPSGEDVALSVALSFLNAWLALWVEMGMGYIGTLYNRVYEKIYPKTDDADEDSADIQGSSEDGMSDLWEDGISKT